jgi:hypothetical protein
MIKESVKVPSEVDFDTSLSWGGLIVRITETTLSVDLMLRLPLIRRPDAPHGLLQPYIAVA